jgi:hypothetical protein
MGFRDVNLMKAVLAYADIHINDFMEASLDKSLKELEDKMDREDYEQGKKDIKKYGTISLEEMKKRLGY